MAKHKSTNHTPTDRQVSPPSSEEPAECVGTATAPLPHGVEEASIPGLRLGSSLHI